MGQAKTKQYNRDRFLLEHSVCCYCGDKATTTDHCPPRSLFERRDWPEGYEFPACDFCNDEGRLNELVIACLYRMSITRKDNYPDESKKLIRGLINNRPDIAAEWLSESRNWQRAKLRESFGDLGDEMRRLGYGVAKLGNRTHEAINYFGKKLGLGLYYKHIGRRLIGRLHCRSISLVPSDILKASLEFAPSIPTLERSSKNLTDQFTYRYNFNSEVGVFYSVVGFKEQLGYLQWAFEQYLYDKLIANDEGFQKRLEETFPERYVCV
jgi:hypothetical protein